ncbi:heparinase II/III domain-containing protein [Bordetella hinzii]|uniref:Heparin-sulfate lyase n=1 Tax=Bordetella hinzii TaxID=103855 RepID=A0AAN1RXN8_9BORD|nr:heparinase II/III family protein [Bordetella hinzii]AKQ57172.1 Heparin-sulfate lyase precursor [Bordetella hinzii]AKQ61640.1 Heparin-sulfate lyase precursor [Bordetella hinzii]AZW17408.1 hypothetical protein CS347_11855 [Bordetella hinzii]KCB24699.1 heparinase II/III-like protein [Bordetella hinzii L60]MBZ0076605.1 heparinase II/III family protein [Bordetella hinzii]
MYPYEDLSNGTPAKTLGAARKILLEGWTRRSYPIVKLTDDIPWKLSSQDERAWNFLIHCLDMLDNLLKAHSITGDRRFLEPCLKVAAAWVTEHSDLDSSEISPLAWYDMAVGIRAYRLSYLYDAADATGELDDADKRLLWNSILQHAEYLSNDKNIAFHNNHGYYQVAGQIAMGRRFASKSPIMAEALDQGRSRLVDMLDQQFTREGVHREHSPDYHRMVYDTLKALVESKLIVDDNIIERAMQIEVALSWFVQPNLRLVNFGDSDSRLMTRSPSDAQMKWSTPEMRFWVSEGRVGVPPTQLTRTFAESGYWIARKPGGAIKDTLNYSYLALNAAFHSRTHKHADDLSFSWSDYGAPILVDAGRYGYIGKVEKGSELWASGHWYSDPWRIYCESTRAHNALEFDDRNYLRKGVKPYGSALLRTGETDSGVVFAEAECKHFSSLRHSRCLFFKPGEWLLVYDWFRDNVDAKHSVKQWFHLGHELELLQDEQQYSVFVPRSSRPLRIASLLAEPRPSRTIIGEEEPVIQGWWSGQERDVVPNYAFHYGLKDVSTGTFATLFAFSKELTPDTAWSKVNVSGRKGQFRWRDATTIHELRIDRPESGDMQVSYSVR